MSEAEGLSLWDVIYFEKKKKEDDKDEADEERAARDREDQQARLACTFEWVQSQYENGDRESGGGSGGVSPEKSESGESERENRVGAGTESVYGRGESKGQHCSAGGTPPSGQVCLLNQHTGRTN
jgi:hypothetical protein